MNAAIRVTNLTRTYARAGRSGERLIANDNLSFEVPRGSIFGLLGENGAGKTTLVHQLLGLLAPTSGDIRVEEVDVVKHPEAAKRLMGFLPQSALPLRYVEVQQALYITGRLRGQTERDARQQTAHLLDTLQLSEYATKFVHKLSGGLMRTTNFAMALMGNPRLVLLDEPTNNLDPARRRLIWETIRTLNRETGLTCVLVTHNLLEAESVLHQLCVMRAGRIIAQGTPGDLKAHWEQRVRLAFRLKETQALTPEECHALSNYGQLQTEPSGEHTLMMPPEQVAAATTFLMQQIGLNRLDHFHIAPPSLEDIYLLLQTH
jgi:ABC-2 type transport system permease protein